MGTVISSEDLRKAAFKNGFNPFKLGLVQGGGQIMAALGLNPDAAYQGWKGRLAQDSSDWNICANCMAALRPYLEGTPHPSGVGSATIPSNPIVGAAAAASAELKYGNKPTNPAPSAPLSPAKPSAKCFIATAACGSDQTAEVVHLRTFRDEILQRSAIGRVLVSVYQFASPPLAGMITRSHRAQSLTCRYIVRPADRFAVWATVKFQINCGQNPAPDNQGEADSQKKPVSTP
jgi:hypothetical protein